MRMLVVENNVVVNVIEAQPGFTLPGFTVVEAPAGVGIGWTLDGGQWVAPPEPESVARTRLTRLEFRDMLTGAEKVAIYTAAESNVQIKIWLDDLAAAEFVELTDARTIAAVNSLETATLIGEGRAAEILAGL